MSSLNLSNKIFAIVQARMSSTRLPGKVMLPVLGKPLIAYLFERLAQCQLLDDILLATSVAVADDPIVEFANAHKIKLYRGSENDVLQRMHGAALQYGASAVVRITGDCPLIDPTLVDEIIDYAKSFRAGVVHNTIGKSGGYPRGMDVEFVHMGVLGYLYQRFTDKKYREHVTLAMYRESTPFSIFEYAAPEDAAWNYRWRLCVDEQADFNLIKEIIERLYPTNPRFTLEDITRLLLDNPELPALNASVKQKRV